MLKNILKKTYLMFNKVKVLHSIPGRIRLFIPSLDQVPEQMKKYEDYTTAILKLKDGIKRIEYSYLTSKILIEYDKEKLAEKDIVDWLNKIWKIIVDNEHIYQGMTVNQIEDNIKKFYLMLKERLEKEV
ncbi:MULTISPECIES: HMA2 domain-containing protein [Fusobacterium]|uniref:HMA2 domain-containing protein n=1 Tax=Fusobacterium TaxID=848 RepID=UPI0025B9E73A|nr:cation transporter [Fusobacterium sp.]MCI5724708.1 cation transporter [Fusobacterium sp.]MDD7409819.1 cation transporter [Fusobacteriaceae bacterium]MDY5305623.1 cation transporter [Fusobacterium gastrosuis]MDY5712941.1 cation transporter [Fusobacterium gastrosuis]